MKYTLIDGVFLHEDEGKIFAINANNNSVFELNEVANIIFKGIEKRKTYNEIFQIICNSFPEIDIKEATEDLDSFMFQLKEGQFIEAI